jgi:hypothetical protein
VHSIGEFRWVAFPPFHLTKSDDEPASFTPVGNCADSRGVRDVSLLRGQEYADVPTSQRVPRSGGDHRTEAVRSRENMGAPHGDCPYNGVTAAVTIFLATRPQE